MGDGPSWTGGRRNKINKDLDRMEEEEMEEEEEEEEKEEGEEDSRKNE